MITLVEAQMFRGVALNLEDIPVRPSNDLEQCGRVCCQQGLVGCSFSH